MDLLKIQYDLRAQLENARINYKKSPKERLTKQHLQKRLELIDKKWQEFDSTHIQLITSKEDLSGTPYFKSDMYQNTEEFYLDLVAEINGKVEQMDIGKSTPSLDDKQPCNSLIKLPKIVIPTFSGSYTEWMSFRDLFKSLVHNNSALQDVQKLHYLKGYLKGEPEQLLRHIAITNENYSQCWALLENRYDNKQYLANSILKRFFSQKPLQTESSTAIKELLDSMMDCLHGLQNLGIDVKSWDIIVIYIVSLKLDQESRKQWEAMVSELTSKSNILPNIDQFQEFLKKRYHSLEFLEPGKSNYKNQFIYSNKNNYSKLNHIQTLHISQGQCAYCKGDHKIIHCKEFCNMSYDEKRDFVQNNGLCFNCLLSNHSSKYCRNSTSCQICQRRHHSLLHPKSTSQPQQSEMQVNLAQNCEDTANEIEHPTSSHHSEFTENFTNHFANENTHNVLLATALVTAESSSGHEHLLRALIDQGSQASFITESVVQSLGLKRTAVKGIVSGLGGDKSVIARSTVQIDIHSRCHPGYVITVKAYVLDKLTTLLPAKRIEINSWPDLKDICLADPCYQTPNKIDILLGAEVYGQIMTDGLLKYQSGSLIAQKTALGWILSGKVNADISASVPVSCNFVALHTQVDHILRSFWELEANITPNKIMSEEERRCEDLYESTTARDPQGRYIVRLPFRDEAPACKQGNSMSIALSRFIGLEQKLQKHPQLKEEYTKVFNEYLELNHMQLVVASHDDTENEVAVYLPYHAVVREDKTTTKVRIVFDASCKGHNGVSLNDDLMVGPQLQADLRHIILRWRLHPVCFSADIVKMYRQVKLFMEDTNYQRILWREDPSQDIGHYKLLRLTFGTSAAPYLAVKTLLQVAKDEAKDYPLAAPIVQRDFYMDDLMSGCENSKQAIEIFKQLNELLERGGFKLQKWVSNSEEMMNKIDTLKNELDSNKEHNNKMEVKMQESNKILGLTWDRVHDEFEYAVHLPPMSSGPVTKRKVISDIARLYDPLGWLAPSIVIGKILIQKIWLSGIEWDEELPEDLLNEWILYRKELNQLTLFRLPRWYGCHQNNVWVELHGFCDASTSAYGAVVYIRIVDANGDVNVNLVTAKTRVAPVKQVSVPRLELCGAVLLSKLLMEVSEVLRIPKEKIHAWTDSEVVLAWLSCHPSKWKTFIGNRVSEIITSLERSHWSYVQSDSNPADAASRGISPEKLINSMLWISGPQWLKEIHINYTHPKHLKTHLEERIIKAHTIAVDQTESVVTGEDFWSKYSSLNKLLRIIAYCRRIMKKEANRTRYISKVEREEALNILIRLSQQKGFFKEKEDLTQKTEVSNKSKLRSLCPYLDDNGIIRVGGRLEQAKLSYDLKHPIVLPHESLLTNHLIAQAHDHTLHGGPQLMLTYLRTRYWIIGAKNLVKLYARKCVTCARYSKSNTTPIMGQLPTSRVSVNRPFLCSGVDYAGPIDIRTSKGRGHKSFKGYICLFICMATRAIHLEAVSDLTTQGFLAAFKRFVGRRGHCKELHSDNGTNFVGAARELKQLFNNERSSLVPEIAECLSNNGTEWHFIPPHSPNFGGLWEAGIKSTKYHLQRIIGNSTLTFEEISTVLIQVEACLNSRPLTSIEDNGQVIPLTPGHFLVGEPLVVAPDNNFENVSISPLKRWQLCQKMLQHFWQRWSQEYLDRFMQRYKWARMVPEPHCGDLVLVKEPNLPPARWLLGIIVEKHTGVDKVTRVVTIRCKNTLIKRSVSKICILPVAT